MAKNSYRNCMNSCYGDLLHFVKMSYHWIKADCVISNSESTGITGTAIVCHDPSGSPVHTADERCINTTGPFIDSGVWFKVRVIHNGLQDNYFRSRSNNIK